MHLPLVKAHRMIAIGLGLFILTHLAVHLTAIGGPGPVSYTHLTLPTILRV